MTPCTLEMQDITIGDKLIYVGPNPHRHYQVVTILEKCSDHHVKFRFSDGYVRKLCRIRYLRKIYENDLRRLDQ